MVKFSTLFLNYKISHISTKKYYAFLMRQKDKSNQSQI